MTVEPIPEVIVYGKIILIHVAYINDHFTGLYRNDPLEGTVAQLIKMHFRIIQRNYLSSKELTDNPRAWYPYLYTSFLNHVKELIDLLNHHLDSMNSENNLKLSQIYDDLIESYDQLLDNFDDGADRLTYY